MISVVRSQSMQNKNVNLKKIERMGVLSFRNAIRLHEDSILLFSNERYPSAYTLSVLALEEVGKCITLEDFVYHSPSAERMDPKDEESWIRSIYNHRHKQNRFAEHINMPQFAKRAIENLYAGKIEAAKQNSIYVGLPRKGRRIDLKGRISTPTRLRGQ